MFKMLGKCLDKLKKDNFLWVPFLFYSLFFSLINRVFLLNPSSFGLKEFVIVYLENISQTFIGVLFVLMIVELSKRELDIYSVWSLFLIKLKSNLIRFSLLLNLPLMCFVFFGIYFSSEGMDQLSLNNAFSVFLLIAGMYIVIPISAFGYFSTIAYVFSKKRTIELLKDIFLFCFKNYRLCIKWFWFILFVNSFQLIVMPLYFSDFILKDVVVSGFQSLLLTLSMMYSYYFYKDHVESKLVSPQTRNVVIDLNSEDVVPVSIVKETIDDAKDRSSSDT